MASIARAEGRGGLPKVVLTSGSGDVAEVYEFGATLCSYVRAGREVLFCGDKALFTGKKAIRGGVPLVFPQFGQPDKNMAQHGFLRNAVWKVDPCKSCVRDDGVAQVVLTLSDSSETQKVWPAMFLAECTVSLGQSWLSSSLKVKNLGYVGDSPAAGLQPQMLLHTYYAVQDISSVAVSSLKGTRYLDKAAADGEPDDAVEDREAVDFTRRVDRVFLAGSGVQSGPVAPLQLTVTGAGGGATIGITCHAQYHKSSGEFGTTVAAFKPDVVLWNPWIEIARDFADMNDEDYKVMLCVEPGLIGDNRPALAVGDSLELVQRLQPSW
mmetsp:Transcript_21780/g.49573  ORF Transcript_21780/g.49573 Transcript_21780/m.49573 type:complete len:324 (+) Transcript_21780:40-1011(+)